MRIECADSKQRAVVGRSGSVLFIFCHIPTETSEGASQIEVKTLESYTEGKLTILHEPAPFDCGEEKNSN